MKTAHKLWAGFGLLIALLLGIGLSIIVWLNGFKGDLENITGGQAPISEATYEMESTLNSAVIGVLQYVDTGQPHHRQRVDTAMADFQQAQAQYEQLAQTPEAKAAGQQIGGLSQAYWALGKAIMERRDQLQTLFDTLGQGTDHMADTFGALLAAIDRAGPDGVEKVEAVYNLKANIGELGTWIGHYGRTGEPHIPATPVWQGTGSPRLAGQAQDTAFEPTGASLSGRSGDTIPAHAVPGLAVGGPPRSPAGRAAAVSISGPASMTFSIKVSRRGRSRPC